MNSPEHKVVTTFAHKAKGEVRGLLALALLALLVITPACNGPKPLLGTSVHLVTISCEPCAAHPPPSGCLEFDPKTDIEVSPGDFIVFIATKKDISLEFSSDLTEDTPLPLKALGSTGVGSAVRMLRVKEDAKKGGVATEYDIAITLGSTQCAHPAPPDHPGVIVNGI